MEFFKFLFTVYMIFTVLQIILMVALVATSDKNR